MGFFDKLKNGLTKTRESIAKQVNNVFSVFVKVDDELFENLEEALIMADIGVETSSYIIEKLRDNVKHKHRRKPCKRGIKEHNKRNTQYA